MADYGERRYYMGDYYPSMPTRLTPGLPTRGYENFMNPESSSPDLNQLLANVLRSQSPTGAPPGDEYISQAKAEVANDGVPDVYYVGPSTDVVWPEYQYDNSWWGAGMSRPPMDMSQPQAPMQQQPDVNQIRGDDLLSSMQQPPNPFQQYLDDGRQMAQDMVDAESGLDRAYELSVAAMTGRPVSEVLNEQKARRINAMNALTNEFNAAVNAQRGAQKDDGLPNDYKLALIAANGDPAKAAELLRNKFVKPAGGSSGTSAMQEAEFLYPGDPEAQRQYVLNKASKPGVSVEVNTGQEKFNETLAKQNAESASAMMNAVPNKAQEKLNTVGVFRAAFDAFQKSGGKPSVAAPFIGWATNLLSSVGMTPASLGLPDNAGPYEVMQSLSAKMTSDLIGVQNGEGFPANSFSNADRTFLQQIPPSVMNTEQGITAKLYMMEVAAKAQQEMSRHFMQWYAQDQTRPFVEWRLAWETYREANPIINDRVKAEISTLLSGKSSGIEDLRQKFPYLPKD